MVFQRGLGQIKQVTKELVDSIIKIFEVSGYSCSINTPFSGSIVPLEYYKKDMRVKSIMIEINRSIYMKNSTEACENKLNKLAKACRQVIELIERY